MNLYHIKLTDAQKSALEHLFSQDITWNKTELEKAWQELRKQVMEAAQHVAIINALQDSGCNCKKPTEPAPKYDPCRLFRKGDLVRLKAYNGRKPYDFWHKQTIEHFGAKLDTVLADELDSGNVDIFQDAPIDELTVRVHASHLELVTPVEELEPYSVHESETINGFDIMRDGLCVMTFPYGAKEHGWYYNKTAAKEDAEAERDRLNEQYRKELE